MKKNQLIVNDREVGKTTYLFNQAKQLLSDGHNIIVLDSATDHAEKSLIYKIKNEFDDAIIIENCDEKQVATYVELNNGIDLIYQFPYNIIKNNIGKILCFDLSYFLEKGHEVYDETGNIIKYTYYRNLYRRMAQQIISTIIGLNVKGLLHDTIILTDEIEFPILDFDVTRYQKDISILSSVHPENGFGTFYQNCEHVDFVPYQMRKEL